MIVELPACSSALPEPSSTTNLAILMMCQGLISYPEALKLLASWLTVIVSFAKGSMERDVLIFILLPTCFCTSGGAIFRRLSMNLYVLAWLLKSWNTSDFTADFIQMMVTCRPIELVLTRVCGYGSLGPFLLATCSSKRPVLQIWLYRSYFSLSELICYQYYAFLRA